MINTITALTLFFSFIASTILLLMFVIFLCFRLKAKWIGISSAICFGVSILSIVIMIAFGEEICPHDEYTVIIAKEATCTEKGIEEHHCTLCGEIEEIDISLLGHTYRNYETVLSPTCSTPGEKTKECTRCGDKQTEIIPATNEHQYNEFIVIKEATCTENGIEERHCSSCDHVDEKEIEPLGHIYDDYEIILSPTCANPGEKKANCNRCGEGLTEEIPATNDHQYTLEESFDFDKSLITCVYTCSECNTQKSETTPLSKDKRLQYLIDNAPTYTYEEIARYPDNYKGKIASFKGEVIQVMGDTLRVSITYNGDSYFSYYSDPIYVTCKAEITWNVLESDIITMYGVLDGEKTYTAVLGNEVTIPKFIAYHIELEE